MSLVDFRTGYLADLEGIRQVIGERLLIVDAMQGFGVVDAPYEVADIVIAGGQKWVRAGWGTGFLALSERAAGDTCSGLLGLQRDRALTDCPWTRCGPPPRALRAFQVSHPDSIAQARFAAALEEIAAVGVPAINDGDRGAGHSHHRARRRVRDPGGLAPGNWPSAPGSSCSSRPPTS